MDIRNNKGHYEYNDMFDLENDLTINGQKISEINPNMVLFVDSKYPLSRDEVEFYCKSDLNGLDMYVDDKINSSFIRELDNNIDLYENDKYHASYTIDKDQSKLLFKNIGLYTLHIKHNDKSYQKKFKVGKKKMIIRFNELGDSIPIYIDDDINHVLTSDEDVNLDQLKSISLVLLSNNNVVAVGNELDRTYSDKKHNEISVKVNKHESIYLDVEFDSEIIKVERDRLDIRFMKPIRINYGENFPQLTGEDLEISSANIEELHMSDHITDPNEYKLTLTDSNDKGWPIDIVSSLMPGVYNLKIQIGEDEINSQSSLFYIAKKTNKIINSLESFYHVGKTLNLNASIKMEHGGQIKFRSTFNNKPVNNIINLNKEGIVCIEAIYDGTDLYYDCFEKYILTVKPKEINIRLRDHSYIVKSGEHFHIEDKIEMNGGRANYTVFYKLLNLNDDDKPLVTYGGDRDEIQLAWNHLNLKRPIKNVTLPKGVQMHVYYEDDGLKDKIVYHGSYNAGEQFLDIDISKIKSIKIVKITKHKDLSVLANGLYQISIYAEKDNYAIKTEDSILYLIDDITFDLVIDRNVMYQTKLELDGNNIKVHNGKMEIDSSLFDVKVLQDTSEWGCGEYDINVEISYNNIKVQQIFRINVVPKKVVVDFWAWWNKIKDNYQEYGAGYVSKIANADEVLDNIKTLHPSYMSEDCQVLPRLEMDDMARAGIYYDVYYDVALKKGDEYVIDKNYQLTFVRDEKYLNRTFVPKLYIVPHRIPISVKTISTGVMMKKINDAFVFSLNRRQRNYYFELDLDTNEAIEPVNNTVEFFLQFDVSVIKHSSEKDFVFTMNKLKDNKVIDSEDVKIYDSKENKYQTTIKYSQTVNTEHSFRVHPVNYDMGDSFRINNVYLIQCYTLLTKNKFNYIDSGRNVLFNEQY